MSNTLITPLATPWSPLLNTPEANRNLPKSVWPRYWDQVVIWGLMLSEAQTSSDPKSHLEVNNRGQEWDYWSYFSNKMVEVGTTSNHLARKKESIIESCMPIIDCWSPFSKVRARWVQLVGLIILLSLRKKGYSRIIGMQVRMCVRSSGCTPTWVHACGGKCKCACRSKQGDMHLGAQFGANNRYLTPKSPIWRVNIDYWPKLGLQGGCPPCMRMHVHVARAQGISIKVHTHSQAHAHMRTWVESTHVPSPSEAWWGTWELSDSEPHGAGDCEVCAHFDDIPFSITICQSLTSRWPSASAESSARRLLGKCWCPRIESPQADS